MAALASPPMQPRTSTLRPFPGESQAEFAERFHGAMASAIPETDGRNEAMLAAWEQGGNDGGLLNRAGRQFPAAQYVRVRNVPVFAEHTTKDSKGNLAVYDRRALAAIVDRCNARILDTGDFPPLTEGHTPTPDEQTAGRSMPDVLGYAGPFRIGLIGNASPRWAIFADEFHHVEDRERLMRLRRRSPEVWLEDRMEDRFLDPIAALGAETPRLDLGTGRYGRRADGRIIEKYSATAPTATGANTTYVPGGPGEKQDRKDRYEGTGMNPEMIDQIAEKVIQAVMSSKPFQWAAQQMEQGEAASPGAEPMPGDATAGPEAAAASPMPGAPPAPGTLPPPPATGGLPKPDPTPSHPGDMDPPTEADDSDTEDAYEPDDDDREQFRRYMAGEADDEEMQQYKAHRRQTRKGWVKRRKQYAAGGTVAENEKPAGEGDVTSIPVDSAPKPGEADVADPKVAKFSRGKHAMPATMTQREREDVARYQKLQDRLDAVEKERDAEKGERRKAERYSKLSQLRTYYAFELDDEAKDTADFTEEQFERHLNRIQDRYQRIPVGTRVHVPAEAEPPKFRARDNGRREATEVEAMAVVALTDRYRKSGKEITWDEGLAEVRKDATTATGTTKTA